jgi:transketolase
MRKAFSNLIDTVGKNSDVIFLTGDLGYNAFENIRESMGERFINMGVAEQNMIGVAAGLAHRGFKVFCYSIAPFVTYRCLEQIRIDVCFHKLPVFIVGNGGGYGYGIMGATHHAIEDLACMSSLPDMTCYVPTFLEDVDSSVHEIINRKKPAYLRLGLGKKNPFNKGNDLNFISELITTEKPLLTVLGIGPVINNVITALENSPYKNQTDIFVTKKIPFDTIDEKLKSSLKKTEKLLLIEEHVSRGGLSEHVSLKLLEESIQLRKLKSLHALGYPNTLYGDQNYHLEQSGLDPANILKTIQSLIEN